MISPPLGFFPFFKYLLHPFLLPSFQNHSRCHSIPPMLTLSSSSAVVAVTVLVAAAAAVVVVVVVVVVVEHLEFISLVPVGVDRRSPTCEVVKETCISTPTPARKKVKVDVGWGVSFMAIRSPHTHTLTQPSHTTLHPHAF